MFELNHPTGHLPASPTSCHAQAHAALLLQHASVVLFDLDGCIYRGDALCPGADQLIAWLKKRGCTVRFVTNNSTHSPRHVAAKLCSLGIDAEAYACRTATEYAGLLLTEHFGSCAVKIIGSQDLEDMTAQAGHQIVPLTSDMTVDALVIGRDIAFNYEKLQQAASILDRGARLIAANPDFSHPGPAGNRVPETGTLTAAVEALSGQRAIYGGKPSPAFFRFALAQTDVQESDCLMIGDNYATDIIGGHGAGMRTIWLKDHAVDTASGAPAADAIVYPDAIADNIGQLYRYVREQD